MSAGSILQTLFVAMSVGAGSAAAQGLTLGGVVSGSPLRVTVEAGGATAVSPAIAKGVDVTAGFALTADLPGASANSGGEWGFTDQLFRAQVHAHCAANGAVAPGVAAYAGRPSVVVQLALSRPMVLRFEAVVVHISQLAPCRGIIDIGDDGVAEVDFALPAGGCDGVSKTVVLDLPAGSFPVRMQVETDLPSGMVLGNYLQTGAFASLCVEAAHVDFTYEGLSCSNGGIGATPMLDGESVRFWVGSTPPLGLGGTPPVGIGLLVFGTAPTQVALPFAPACSLLVVPDVVMVMPASPFLVVPLAGLGPVDLLAQGVFWQPNACGPGCDHMASSQRVVLHVR